MSGWLLTAARHSGGRTGELVLALTEDAGALLGAALATTPAVAPDLAAPR